MRHKTTFRPVISLTLLGLCAMASTASAQTPLRDDAPVVVETLPAADLQDVVGRVALYPDDLLAVVLPASVYPLQVVQAARFLDERDRDSSLQPDPTWDESVVALLNYPEVLRMMSDDLDWTYDLGTAVVNQQPDVIDAIETFRDRAYDAGNLKSDERVVVARDDADDAITITPVEREVVYVPYYEPERVVVVQRAPVIQYYPHPFPLYYYPYRTFVGWHNPHFYGVSTAFQIGWATRNVHFHLHNYASHPFFGRAYVRNFYYHHRFQPTRLRAAPRSFTREGYANGLNRAYRGDRWRPVGQRSVRSFGQTRQRAASVSRQASANVRTLKPRDARNRAAASATRRANTSFTDRAGTRQTRSFAAAGTRSSRSAAPSAQTRRSVSSTRSDSRSTAARPSYRTAKPQATTRTTTTSRTTTTRQSAPRVASTRSTTTRQAAPQRSTTYRSTTRTTREAAPRTTRQRQTTTRQTTTRQSVTRQTATRQSAPRQSAPRQSTTRQSTTRQSAPRQSSSRASSRSRSSGNSNRSRR